MTKKIEKTLIERGIEFILKNKGKYCCLFEEGVEEDLENLVEGMISELHISDEESVWIKIFRGGAEGYEVYHLDFSTNFRMAIIEERSGE